MTPQDGTDLSNMGRCVRCGDTIDMRDDGDEIVVYENNVPDHPEIDEQDVRDAMGEAIRSVANSQDGQQADHTIADAWEDGEEITLHASCYAESVLPDMESDIPEDHEYA
jgi:hypothetical protein